MNKSLLIDWIPFEVDRRLINEAIRENKPFTVSGILQRSDAKNHNGRVYPHNILMRESQKYEEEFVRQNRAMGELDHPDSSVVELKNVSHIIKEMHWEGKDLVGECEILTTPAGNILRELFKCGVKLGISSRGLGSVDERPDGTVMVQEDFELIAFDFVSNPSTHGAFQFLKGIDKGRSGLNESINKQTILNQNNNIYRKSEELIRDILTEI